MDAFLAQDENAKCGIEVLAKNNSVVLAGEVNSTAQIDYDTIVKEVCKKIGYTEEYGYDLANIRIINLIDKQTQEIANSVHINKKPEDIGAGD